MVFNYLFILFLLNKIYSNINKIEILFVIFQILRYICAE